MYSQYLNRKLYKDTLSPSFVMNLKLVAKVLKYCTLIGGSELEYLTNILLELGTGAIQNDAAGLSKEFRVYNKKIQIINNLFAGKWQNKGIILAIFTQICPM